MNTPPLTAASPEAQVFSFGDPEAVITEQWLDYLSSASNGDYYEPPLPRVQLAKVAKATAHQGAAIQFRRNMLAMTLQANDILSNVEARRAAYNFVAIGDCHLQAHRNGLGRIVRLSALPSVNMRRLDAPEERYGMLQRDGTLVKFKHGEVINIRQDDLLQSLYGVPDWICGLHSVLLNEDSTLFRRRYYKNGAHAGYILVANEQMDPETEKSLTSALKSTKGIGNFRSMYVSFPRGSKSREPIKLLPIGDVATRDIFAEVKKITRDDTLAMHRLPPALAGMAPEGGAAFGDIEKTARVYGSLEIGPWQALWADSINPHLRGGQKIKFLGLEI